MYWSRLTKRQYHTDPIEHIYATGIFPTTRYDSLYENQNNLQHEVWIELDREIRTGFEFKQDINDVDTKREVTALWFFKDRNDRLKGKDITLQGKVIFYQPNHFLLTTSTIQIHKRTNNWTFNRPVIQLDLNINDYNKITKKFK